MINEYHAHIMPEKFPGPVHGQHVWPVCFRTFWERRSDLLLNLAPHKHPNLHASEEWTEHKARMINHRCMNRLWMALLPICARKKCVTINKKNTGSGSGARGGRGGARFFSIHLEATIFFSKIPANCDRSGSDFFTTQMLSLIHI